MNPLDYLNPLIEALTKLHGPPLVIVFLIVNGYMLKMTKVFPNRFIPLVNAILAPALTILLVEWPDKEQTWMLKVKWPAIAAWATSLLQGTLYNFIAWVGHAKFLRKWIDDKVPAMSGNTDIIAKPPQ